jgi:hypothetical protein
MINSGNEGILNPFRLVELLTSLDFYSPVPARMGT